MDFFHSLFHSCGKMEPPLTANAHTGLAVPDGRDVRISRDLAYYFFSTTRAKGSTPSFSHSTKKSKNFSFAGWLNFPITTRVFWTARRAEAEKSTRWEERGK
jgi:hypothetical protein